MTAAETDEKKVQPAVATKAVERRETEKPGRNTRLRKRKRKKSRQRKGAPQLRKATPRLQRGTLRLQKEHPDYKGEHSGGGRERCRCGRKRLGCGKELSGCGNARKRGIRTAKTSGCGEAINERFVRFLRRHHVLTLATVAEGVPYCSNAFYCYDKERNLLVFSSDLATRHAQEMERNPRIAASVVLETKIVGRVQGLQLCGTAARADETARRAYLKRFPYAALAELTLWAIRPDYMKLTDNTLGFGKKLIWNDKLESSS